MAGKAGSPIGPDADDIDGQSGSVQPNNGNTSGEINNDSATGPIDPASLAGTGDGNDEYARDDSGAIIRKSDGTPARKRGRKPGTGSGTRNAFKKSTARNSSDIASAIDTLSKVLMITHTGLATAFKSPELELDEKEAKALADASAKVMSEFDIAPDPKFIAVAGLVTTATSIYGPRIYLIKLRKAEAKQSKPTNVEQFTPMPNIDPNSYPLGG